MNSIKSARLRGVPIAEKLAIKSVTSESGCRLWVGSVSPKGYGVLEVNKKARFTHRVAYEIAYGPIPDGLLVCHRCDTPACINPEHLFLGTNADNMADMVSKNRQARIRGEGHVRAKLNLEQVHAILASDKTNLALAVEYGVSKSLISHIRTGRNWHYVERADAPPKA